jgi:hypothetical protein
MEYEAFDEISARQNQAMHCAATVVNNSIYGFYGSTIADGMKFEFKTNRPIEIEEGNICDQCIQNLIDNDKIIVKKEGQFFGFSE